MGGWMHECVQKQMGGWENDVRLMGEWMSEHSTSKWITCQSNFVLASQTALIRYHLSLRVRLIVGSWLLFINFEN